MLPVKERGSFFLKVIQIWKFLSYQNNMHLILLCSIDTHDGVIVVPFVPPFTLLGICSFTLQFKANYCSCQTNCFFFTSKCKYSVPRTGLLSGQPTNLEPSMEKIMPVIVELDPCCRRYMPMWSCLLLRE